MGDLNNTESAQNQVVADKVLTAITGQDGKTTEEIAAEAQKITDAQDELDESKRAAALAEQLQKTNDFFNAANYVTPVAPSNDKLTNEDFFPSRQNYAQGHIQGKFFSSNSYASQVLAPMAAIENRRKELAQQAYAKAKNAEIARQKVLSFKVTAAPQFVSEINDRAMLYSQQMAKKYGNNYEALLRDPEYINTMRRFDEQGKSTLITHERILKMQKDAQKGDLIISPEDAKFADEYLKGTGNLDAEYVANGIIDGTFKATDFADKIQTYDNLKAWSTPENLKRFVRTVSDEELMKAPKGTYSKLEKLTVKDTFMDKAAHEAGLAQYVRDHKLYNAGNPDAPVGTPEHDKWVKFANNQWEADKANGDKLEKEKSLVESGKSQEFQDSLARRKFAYQQKKDSASYYGDVDELVNKKDDMSKISSIKNWTNQYNAYQDYMKQFPTNKYNGYKSIQLGTPTNSSGTWSVNQAGFIVDKKQYSVAQVIQKSESDKNWAKSNAQVVKEAKIAAGSKSGNFQITSEEAAHFVKNENGKLIPLELSGGKYSGGVVTCIIQKGRIITGYDYKNVDEKGKPTPIVSKSEVAVIKPIGKGYEKANLLNANPSSKEEKAATEYGE